MSAILYELKQIVRWEFWIWHPAADGAPVGLWRYLLWRYSEFLDRVIVRLGMHRSRAESRALYPDDPLPSKDDIPF